MHFILKTQHKPTIIENCKFANLLTNRQKTLILSGKNYLYLYEILEDKLLSDYFINHLASYSFLENIISLDAVFLTDINSYGLILSFADAKFSLLKFDPGSYNFVTLALFNFENDDFKNGLYQCFSQPGIACDPSNQCAALNFYNTNFALLPLSIAFGTHNKENGFSELIENTTQIYKDSTIKFNLPSLIMIDMKHVLPKITTILDFTFLYGYYEPTLLVLYEPFQTWAGKVTKRQETVCMVALSINLTQKAYPIIWTMTNLPYDSLRAIPVPIPLGGVIVLAVNSILYLNQKKSIPVSAIALNSLAPAYYTNSYPKDQTMALFLEHGSAHATFFDATTMLVSTGTNSCDSLSSRYIIIRFLENRDSNSNNSNIPSSPPPPSSKKGKTGYEVKEELDDFMALMNGKIIDSPLIPTIDSLRLQIEFADYFPPPYNYIQANNMCYCGRNLIFISSHVSDSVFIGVERITPKTSHRRLNSSNSNADGTNNTMLNIQGELIFQTPNGDLSPPVILPEVKVGLTSKVFDQIVNIGPANKFSLGHPIVNGLDFYANVYEDAQLSPARLLGNELNDPDLEIILTSGRDESGGLALLQKSVIPQLITTFTLPGINNMWTLFGESSVRNLEEMIDGITGTTNDADEGIENSDYHLRNEHNTFLLLSLKDSSLVLKTGLEIVELEKSGFNTQAPTLAADNFKVIKNNSLEIDNADIIIYYTVQVTNVDIRLLKGDTLIQDIAYDGHGITSNPVVAAYLCDPYILIMDETFQCTLFKMVAVTFKMTPNAHTDPNANPQITLLRDTGHHKILPKPPILALNMYCDESGLFNYSKDFDDRFPESTQITNKTDESLKENKDLGLKIGKNSPERFQASTSHDDDEVDELLYGKAAVSSIDKFNHSQMTKDEMGTKIKNISDTEFMLKKTTHLQADYFSDKNLYRGVIGSDPLSIAKTTYWVLVCRINGLFEIFSVPSLVIRYSVQNFHLKLNVLRDDTIFCDKKEEYKDGISLSPQKKKLKKSGDKPLQADDDMKQNLLDSYQVREIALVGIKVNRESNSIKNDLHCDPLDGEGTISSAQKHEVITTCIKPYLIALVNDNILIYEAYPFLNPNQKHTTSILPGHQNLEDKLFDGHIECSTDKLGKDHQTLLDLDMIELSRRLNIQFKKIEHNMLLLGERKAAKTLPKKDNFYKLFNTLRTTSMIRPFNNINFTPGVFIQGLLPHWLIPGDHGDLKIHPMTVDGPVYAFTPFHNVNCSRGFLYFNHKDELRVCLLSTHLDYKQEWPTKKICLGETVHFVEYHVRMKVYVIVTSRKSRPKQQVKCLNNFNTAAAFATLNTGGIQSRNVPIAVDEHNNIIPAVAAIPTTHTNIQEDGTVTMPIASSGMSAFVDSDELIEEKEMEDVNQDPFYPAPRLDEFTIQLIDPSTWTIVPSARINLNSPWERITSFRQIPLASQGTVSGLKDYLVVGTACVYGEDMACRGRLFILDIIEVVPEPGKPLTKYKIKILCMSEQKGPVIDVGGVSGNLITIIGQKIYVWSLNNSCELTGLAFIDTSLCVHTIAAVKDLIIIGDLHKSVTFLRHDPITKSLSIASREFSPISIDSLQFIVDNEKLSFIASDLLQNFVIFAYQPQLRESYGGQKLVRKGDIHVGTNVTSFFRLFCKRKDPTSDKKPSLALERRQTTFYIGQDGRIGYVLPVSEKLYRRLSTLQNFLDNNVFYACGLNPKLARAYRFSRQHLTNSAKNILDGNLIFQFLHYNALQQELICKNSGISLDQVIDDLMEIDRTNNHF